MFRGRGDNDFPGSHAPPDQHRHVFQTTFGHRFNSEKIASPKRLLVTFDGGGGAMDDPEWDEAANGAYFRNFLSGMS